MRKGLEYFLISVQSVADLPPSISEAVQQCLANADESTVHAILIIPPQKRSTQRGAWPTWRAVVCGDFCLRFVQGKM